MISRYVDRGIIDFPIETAREFALVAIKIPVQVESSRYWFFFFFFFLERRNTSDFRELLLENNDSKSDGFFAVLFFFMVFCNFVNYGNSSKIPI